MQPNCKPYESITSRSSSGGEMSLKTRIKSTGTIKIKEPTPKRRLLVAKGIGGVYFTLSTIALKAAGLFMARSARTFLLISIPALWMSPMSLL